MSLTICEKFSIDIGAIILNFRSTYSGRVFLKQKYKIREPVVVKPNSFPAATQNLKCNLLRVKHE